jgi:two-component system chemotaxis sensor kinase CheA
VSQPPQTVQIDYAALRQMFMAEAAEALDEMEQALLALEQHPDDDAGIQTVFRLCHTIKGNASSLRLPALAELAHALEDVLERLRSREMQATDSTVSLLLEALDALRELAPVATEGAPLHRRHAELVARLRLLARPHDGGAGGVAARPSAAASQDASEKGRSRTLRVDVAVLDRILDLTGEIAVARGRLHELLASGPRAASSALEAHREAERLHADLQELVMRVRMVPLGPTLARYARVVRDAAESASKSVRFELRGGDVLVDTKVIEYIVDPITHLVRNAVAHGIESREARAAAGKRPDGLIALSATREGGNILIEVADDGAGLDRGRILETARSRGLVASEAAPSDAEVDRLIFEAGFSTAENVSELSGRGVGLDVVRRNVEALRGTLSVASQAGQGARFTIRLPLTLAIIQGFAVAVGGETFVVPLESVVGCGELPKGGEAGPTELVNLRGEALPCLRLRSRMGVPGGAPAREHVLLVEHRRRRVGLIADELLGDTQTVIKPLGRLFQGLRGVAASTLLGDGRVGLLLDVAAIVDEAA